MKRLLYVPLIFALFSCRETYSPKPRGYYRIDLPEKSYQLFKETCPYSFEYPKYSVLYNDSSIHAEPYWINIYFPQFNGTLHLSYKPIRNNLKVLVEDAHAMAYKHTVKADAIEEQYIKNELDKVYGLLYEIKGNAASSLQFFVTDSSSHFLRGALYFQTNPNKDSLAPVIDFVRQDLIHLIETITWNKTNLNN